MSVARYAYLGPEGTFTEAAVRLFDLPPGARPVPYATVPIALEAVRSGEADGAVVPLENSVEGGVTVTLDELAAGEPLHIRGEGLLPVDFALLVRPGTALDACKRLATHPHAAAQCRRWVARHLPGVETLTASSTAGAAAMVSDPDSGIDAAIAAPISAEHYGLTVLCDGIGDNPEAVTRFVLVTPPAPPPPTTGSDKTSVVAYIRDDHPGALLEILEEFAVRGINLTRIESRPTGNGLGQYCFSIDCEGHVAEARVGEALMGLRRVCADARFLGSYARADGVPATVRTGTSDAAFADAADWLARLRHG